MSRLKRVTFDGVHSRDLSKHLRNNGVKVTTVTSDQEFGVLNVRSDLPEVKLRELAQQLKGCRAVVVDVARA